MSDVADDLPMAEAEDDVPFGRFPRVEDRLPSEQDKIEEEEEAPALDRQWTLKAADDFEGEPISIDEATRLIRKRLGRISALDVGGGTQFGYNIHAEAAEFSRRIAMAMPEELRTEDLLKNGDLRPLFAQVMQQRQVDGSDEGDTRSVNGVNFTPVHRAIAMTAYMNERTRITKAVRSGLDENAENLSMSQSGQDLLANEGQSMVDFYNTEAREGRIQRVPTFDDGFLGVDPATGRVLPGNPTQQSAIDALNGAVMAEGDATAKFLTEKEYQSLFTYSNNVSAEVDQIIADERELARLRAQGTTDDGTPLTVEGSNVRVLYDDQGRGLVGGRSPEDVIPGGYSWSESATQSSRWAGQNAYTVTQVLQKPSEMTREEVLKLTERLEKAGYFEAGGKPIHRGSATDTRFKAAWKQLVGQSIESGESMMSILDSRQDAFEEALADATTLALTDPARIRRDSDVLGRNIINRQLTSEEHTKLIEFVHGLERRNAMIEGGFSTTGEVDPETGLDANIMADIDARMAEFIRGSAPTEAGAADLSNTYDDFTDIIRGPGGF